MTNYKQKYLKYKIKYLNYKTLMKGGYIVFNNNNIWETTARDKTEADLANYLMQYDLFKPNKSEEELSVFEVPKETDKVNTRKVKTWWYLQEINNIVTMIENIPSDTTDNMIAKLQILGHIYNSILKIIQFRGTAEDLDDGHQNVLARWIGVLIRVGNLIEKEDFYRRIIQQSEQEIVNYSLTLVFTFRSNLKINEYIEKIKNTAYLTLNNIQNKEYNNPWNKLYDNMNVDIMDRWLEEHRGRLEEEAAQLKAQLETPTVETSAAAAFTEAPAAAAFTEAPAAAAKGTSEEDIRKAKEEEEREEYKRTVHIKNLEVEEQFKALGKLILKSLRDTLNRMSLLDIITSCMKNKCILKNIEEIKAKQNEILDNVLKLHNLISHNSKKRIYVYLTYRDLLILTEQVIEFIERMGIDGFCFCYIISNWFDLSVIDNNNPCKILDKITEAILGEKKDMFIKKPLTDFYDDLDKKIKDGKKVGDVAVFSNTDILLREVIHFIVIYATHDQLTEDIMTNVKKSLAELGVRRLRIKKYAKDYFNKLYYNKEKYKDFAEYMISDKIEYELEVMRTDKIEYELEVMRTQAKKDNAVAEQSAKAKLDAAEKGKSIKANRKETKGKKAVTARAKADAEAAAKKKAKIEKKKASQREQILIDKIKNTARYDSKNFEAYNGTQYVQHIMHLELMHGKFIDAYGGRLFRYFILLALGISSQEVFEKYLEIQIKTFKQKWQNNEFLKALVETSKAPKSDEMFDIAPFSLNEIQEHFFSFNEMQAYFDRYIEEPEHYGFETSFNFEDMIRRHPPLPDIDTPTCETVEDVVKHYGVEDEVAVERAVAKAKEEEAPELKEEPQFLNARPMLKHSEEIVAMEEEAAAQLEGPTREELEKRPAKAASAKAAQEEEEAKEEAAEAIEQLDLSCRVGTHCLSRNRR